MFQTHDIVTNGEVVETTEGAKVPVGSFFRINHIERTSHPNPTLNAEKMTLEVTGSTQRNLIGKTVQLDRFNFKKVGHAVTAL